MAAPSAGARAHGAGLERAYNKFIGRHGNTFSYTAKDGCIFVAIAKNPSPNAVGGLGCTICASAASRGIISPTVFSAYKYMGQNRSVTTMAPKLELEVLKRHCNISASQSIGKRPVDKHHAKAVRWMGAVLCELAHGASSSARAQISSCTAPSDAQIRIAVEILNGWGGSSLEDYSRRCNSAREQGASIPHTRCSAEVGRQIIMAAAEVEFDFDRKSVMARALEISWAQDKCNDTLLMKYRAVCDDWQVHCRVIDAIEPRGDRATQCALDMASSLRRLFTPHGQEHDARGEERFKAICRNANADGEPAEQLAFRLAKGTGALPNLDFITRAEEHSAALVLSRAVRKCDYVEPLLGKLVHNFTKQTVGGRAKCPGGMARFIQDSHKLRRKYSAQSMALTGKAFTDLCAKAGVAAPARSATSSVHFCMARFDCWVDPCEEMLRSVRTPISVLVDEAADPSGFQGWARGLLDSVFTYEPLVLMALTTEILRAGQAWVHGRDQRKRGTFQSICIATRLNMAFQKELHELIECENPIAFSKRYTLGTTNIVLNTLRDSYSRARSRARHACYSYVSGAAAWQGMAVDLLGWQVVAKHVVIVRLCFRTCANIFL